MNWLSANIGSRNSHQKPAKFQETGDQTLKFLRIFIGLLTALIGQNAWAVCDAETNQFRDAYHWHIRGGNNTSVAAKYAEEMRNRISENIKTMWFRNIQAHRIDNQKRLDEYRRHAARDPKDSAYRMQVADATLVLCMLDSYSATGSNGPVSSTQSAGVRPEVAWRGSPPQSTQDCFEIFKQKGMNAIDQMDQHLACMTEFSRSRRTSAASIPAGNTSDSNQSQQLQAAAQQAQAAAMNVQQRADADAQRRGRRVHDPAAEAHDCISLNSGAEPTNTCNYKVAVVACVTEPRNTNNMLNNNQYFQCKDLTRPGGGGLWTPSPGGTIYGIYTRTAGMVHWFACKEPSGPAEVTFDGTQLSGRCR